MKIEQKMKHGILVRWPSKITASTGLFCLFRTGQALMSSLRMMSSCLSNYTAIIPRFSSSFFVYGHCNDLNFHLFEWLSKQPEGFHNSTHCARVRLSKCVCAQMWLCIHESASRMQIEAARVHTSEGWGAVTGLEIKQSEDCLWTAKSN